MATRAGARVGLAATALAGSFVAGMVVAQTGGGQVTDPVRLTHAALRPASSCEELRQWFVDRALDQVTAWGWGDPYPVYYADDLSFGVGEAGGPVPVAGARTEEVGSSETGTNVQEAGVDEPDTVKTSGHLMVTVDGDVLTTYDVSGDAPVKLGQVVLPGVDSAEILLSGDTVVAVGPERGAATRRALPGRPFPGLLQETRLTVVDVGHPSDPTVSDTRVFDAETVAVRLHGDVVRVVLSSGLPDLDFTSPSGGRWSQWRARAHNRAVVRESTIEDWLPTVSDGGRTTAADLVDCADVALPDAGRRPGLTTVVAFPADRPEAAETTAVAGDARTAYLSTDRLYLASSPWTAGWIPGPMPVEPLPEVRSDALTEPEMTPEDEASLDDMPIDPVPSAVDPRLIAPASTPTKSADDAYDTRLYAFTLDGTHTDYLASGRVRGQVADRWAMDAVDGTLRVAVGPTDGTANANAVVTLAEQGSDLVEIGRVDGLGVGEQIKSVRWFDDLAIVVTFRQTDPLYAVDLGDPAAPRLLGELKIPGFSEYLHPIGDERLLGVGQSATLRGQVTGAQLALFDVSDLTSPTRLDVASLGRQTSALAGQDPRQFTWLPDRDTALTVVSDWRTGRGSVVIATVDGDRLRTRTVQVTDAEGDAGPGGLVRGASGVRLVPVADGRVVLWTGARVSFLSL